MNTKTHKSIASKLREQAIGLSTKIEAKACDQVAWRLTTRQVNMMKNRINQSESLSIQQAALYALADLHEKEIVDPQLRLIKQRSQVATIIENEKFPYGFSSLEARLERAKVTPMTYNRVRMILLGMIDGAEISNRYALSRAKVNAASKARSIRGYHPTPPEVGSLMLQYAEIKDGMEVLEPSAGNGSLADLIRSNYRVNLTCFEIAPVLQQVLTLSGFNVAGPDFLRSGMDHLERYDRIIMNPPFSKGRDIAHVRQAYKCLKFGGRLVAIMSEGVFFRKDASADVFRNWLKGGQGYQVHDLQAGAFKKSGTNIKARIVVIDR